MVCKFTTGSKNSIEWTASLHMHYEQLMSTTLDDSGVLLLQAWRLSDQLKKN